MPDFYIYILQCADGSYYVGQTDDLETRIGLHHEGQGCNYTSTRLPVRLVYSENFQTREEAFAAERKLKGWSRKKKEMVINYGWESLQG